MTWRTIAEQQQKAIDELVKFCDDLLMRLSQFENIEEEERQLRELEGDKTNEFNITYER